MESKEILDLLIRKLEEEEKNRRDRYPRADNTTRTYMDGRVDAVREIWKTVASKEYDWSKHGFAGKTR